VHQAQAQQGKAAESIRAPAKRSCQKGCSSCTGWEPAITLAAKITKRVMAIGLSGCQ
jgi:hypothetical protein